MFRANQISDKQSPVVCVFAGCSDSVEARSLSEFSFPFSLSLTSILLYGSSPRSDLRTKAVGRVGDPPVSTPSSDSRDLASDELMALKSSFPFTGKELFTAPSSHMSFAAREKALETLREKFTSG